MEKSAQGHNTNYITQFAASIEGASMPAWVVDAEKHAAAVVKATQVTHSKDYVGASVASDLACSCSA